MRIHAFGLALIVFSTYTPDTVVRCTVYALTYQIKLKGTQCCDTGPMHHTPRRRSEGQAVSAPGWNGWTVGIGSGLERVESLVSHGLERVDSLVSHRLAHSVNIAIFAWCSEEAV